MTRWPVVAAFAATGALLLSACSVLDGDGASDGSGSSSPANGEPRPTAPPNAPTVPPSTMSESGFSYEWNRLTIGAGGWVTGLVIHPTATDVMYARTDVGGAYRWNATDEAWEQMLLDSNVPDRKQHPATDDYQVEAIAISPSDPDRVYISVGGDFNPGIGAELPRNGRVMTSSDRGHTWASSTQSFFISGNQSVRQLGERLAVDPLDPDIVYLGTRREGLWRSADAGRTWEQIPTDQVSVGLGEAEDVDHPGVTFVTFDPTSGDVDGRTARLYAGAAGAGVFRSDDAGETWRRIAEITQANISPQEGSVTDGRLLVATNITNGEGPGRVELYEPQTDTFTDITPPRGATNYAAAVDPTDPQRLIAADLSVRDDSLWRSTDGGASWESLKISTSAPSMPWMEASDIEGWMSIGRFVFDPHLPGRLWFAEGMGVWRADDVFDDDDEVVWNIASDGIEQLVTSDIVAPPGGEPVSAVADRQGFRHVALDRSPGAPLVDDRFAGGADIDYAGQSPKDLVWIGSQYQIYWDPNREARAAYSSDGGETWTELPNLVKDMFAGNVAVSATDPTNIVWLPSYYINPWEYTGLPKGLYVTTDRGEHWTTLPNVGGSNRFHRLSWWLTRQALASDKVDGGVFYLVDDEEKFLISTDGGLTWTPGANPPPCRESNACHVFGQLKASPDRAGELWAGVGDDGLYRTTDRGATPWQKIEGIDFVRAFGFGAPLPGHDRPAIYVDGRAQGEEELGLWRSADEGATWELIGRYPLGLYKDVNVVNGDMDLPGRVYVGFSGTGFAYGDDPAVR
jgi:hypothetical protein